MLDYLVTNNEIVHVRYPGYEKVVSLGVNGHRNPGGCIVGPIVSNVEQARYDVVESHGKIEIRDYAPMIVAEVSVPGDRKTAISEGFRKIADFIFGNNVSSQKVAMTAPVTQKPGEKTAMTAPVTQQGGEGLWQVRFVMPSSHTMGVIRKPENSQADDI